MINSIQHFQEKGVKNLSEIFSHYTDDLTRFAEMVYGVTGEVTRLGLSMIEEELESYDKLLRKRQDLRKGWYIERCDETKLLTSLGEIRYSRTYFHNKETGEYCYLLDQLMGLEKHARISEDAEARILEEAVESSYRKGGIHASIGEQEVSKETVMNKLHALEFPLLEPVKEKRKVTRLYIDADEDHVSLQYIEKKGDIKKPRTNTVMPKLIYVYEDVNFDGSKHELVQCSYFGGDYAGTEGTGQMWREVFDYIKDSYDEDALEKIYINGDGDRPNSMCYMWVHRSGEFYKDRPVVVYEYQKGRDHEKPLDFYRDYKGILVTDSLAQYHLLDRKLPHVTNANCWAHARRAFADAVKAADKKDPQVVKNSVAYRALQKIAEFYSIDTGLKDLPKEERLKQRQEKI